MEGNGDTKKTVQAHERELGAINERLEDLPRIMEVLEELKRNSVTKEDIKAIMDNCMACNGAIVSMAGQIEALKAEVYGKEEGATRTPGLVTRVGGVEDELRDSKTKGLIVSAGLGGMIGGLGIPGLGWLAQIINRGG
jgi:hypothetical protein